MTKTTVRIKRKPPRGKGKGREQSRPIEDDRAGLDRVLAPRQAPKPKPKA